jgi:hypothetical protein
VHEPERDPALRRRAVRAASRSGEERDRRHDEHDSHATSIRAAFGWCARATLWEDSLQWK